MRGLYRIIRFGLVGTVGFVADSLVLKGLQLLGVNLYLGQIIAYLAAATVTWIMNRRFTFRATKRSSLGEWLRYLGANALGGVLNYAAFAVCIGVSVLFREHPYLAVALGSLLGMVVNYTLSLLFVFRHRSA